MTDEDLTLEDALDMVEDRCRYCGAFIGFGIRALHLGVCDDCHATHDTSPDEPAKGTA